MAWRTISLLAGAALAVAPMTSGLAQECNPIIDGTYCATQMKRKAPTATPDSRFRPMENIARDLVQGQERPGTLGALTFKGSETCIGLLRRGTCG
jgi:hypothetical protein